MSDILLRIAELVAKPRVDDRARAVGHRYRAAIEWTDPRTGKEHSSVMLVNKVLFEALAAAGVPVREEPKERACAACGWRKRFCSCPETSE